MSSSSVILKEDFMSVGPLPGALDFYSPPRHVEQFGEWSRHMLGHELEESDTESSSKGPEIVVSIKPRFSNLIFQGEKDFELRRKISIIAPKSVAFVYETAPTKALIGAFEIIRVYHLPLDELWALVGSQSGTTYERFMGYFAGKDTGNAIHIGWRRKLQSPIDLDTIREIVDGFRPPQNYMFLNRGGRLARHLRNECPNFFHHCLR